MRWSVLVLSIYLLLVPGLAFAYLSQDDEITLTRNLEVLSSGWSDKAALSAKNIILYNGYTAGNWETFFNKYFVCLPSCAPTSKSEHSFTNSLFDYLTKSIIFDSLTDPSDTNLQTGLINPLWTRIRDITSTYPKDLGMVLFNNVSLRQTLFNANRLFALLAEKGAINLSVRTNLYYNYKVYIKTYPQYFNDATTVDYFAQPFVNLLRAQVWMSFRESLPMTSMLAREISSTIGLGQGGPGSAKKLDIWSDVSSRPLFIDNNGLDIPQLTAVYDILEGMTPGIHNIKYYAVDYFLEKESGLGVIINKGDLVNYNLAITPDNLLQYSFNNTRGQAEEFKTKTSLPPDTWNHVAVTLDGNTVTMYLNGIKDVTYTAKALPNSGSSKPLELGRQISQRLWMRGKLDEIKIYGRVFSDAEISDDYNNQPVSTAKLVSYYRMDEPRGAFVVNSPSLENNGTNFGALIVPGKINNGLFFNGKDSYVDIPDTPSLRLDGPMTLEAWVYFVNESASFHLLVPGIGNISEVKVGAAIGNPFPSDISPGAVDTFSEVAVHEFNHAVDYFFSFGSTADSKLSDRKDQLIRQAGTEPLQYLRSMFVNPDGSSFFPIAPQEFFASISNQYFTDSWHSFDLAMERFKKGYKEPINQFLFFADVYSRGAPTTKFYTLNKKGVLTVNEVSIRRDFLGYITEIARVSTNTVYHFILDFKGNVLFYTTSPINKNVGAR